MYIILSVQDNVLINQHHQTSMSGQRLLFSAGQSRTSRSCRVEFVARIAKILLAVLALPFILFAVVATIVFTPFVVAFAPFLIAKARGWNGNLATFGSSCCSLVVMLCIGSWPFLIVFWLGPWRPEASALGLCVCFLLSSLCSYCLVFAASDDLKEADQRIRGNEVSDLQLQPFWYLYIFVTFLDWYQFSALYFSTPDLILPPSVIDFFEWHFSSGRWDPDVIQQRSLLPMIVASNLAMSVLLLFVGFMVFSFVLKKLIVWWALGAERSSDSENSWARASKALEKFPWCRTVVTVLDQADFEKRMKDIQIGSLVFQSCLVGVTSLNLHVIACTDSLQAAYTTREEGEFSANRVSCWSPRHTGAALTAGLCLNAFLLAGLISQIVSNAKATSETGQTCLATHPWLIMVQQPLKLLCAALVVQTEILEWTRVRLIVIAVSTAAIALSSTAFWSTNHNGLNKFRLLVWWSICINGASAWAHFEMGSEDAYVGLACFALGHMVLAAVFFSDSGCEPIFLRAGSTRMLRRCSRFSILLTVMLVSALLGILPELLNINTGSYTEEDLSFGLVAASEISEYSVTIDSCAIFVWTDSDISKQKGRLRTWGGSIRNQSLEGVVIVDTLLEACELYILLPPNVSFNLDCRFECTLDLSADLVRSSVVRRLPSSAGFHLVLNS